MESVFNKDVFNKNIVSHTHVLPCVVLLLSHKLHVPFYTCGLQTLHLSCVTIFSHWCTTHLNLIFHIIFFFTFHTNRSFFPPRVILLPRLVCIYFCIHVSRVVFFLELHKIFRLGFHVCNSFHGFFPTLLFHMKAVSVFFFSLSLHIMNSFVHSYTCSACICAHM